MAGTSHGSRRERESDSMEALKPLLVLGLFGMILYGAYSVVQKGPTPAPDASAAVAAATDAPPFAPPSVQLAAPQPVGGPATPAPTVSTAESAATSPAVAATAGPTYLAAESAAPPSADQVVAQPMASRPTPPPFEPPAQPEPATLAPAATLPPVTLPAEPPAALAATANALAAPAADAPAAALPMGRESSAAFASAWADAHDKLTAGRYAEALAALSVWYDDPALGLEESQRLEDLLGQLAGTVIYSQQDLLMPPHVVAAGETLDTVAGPLGVSPRLIAKINGVDDPQRLVPGEHLKVIRGPFDAVVSVSRRRVSLQLNGAYAGSFPVVVGRRYLERVGASLPVVDVQRGAEAAAIQTGTAMPRKAIVLGEGLVIEAADDPVAVADSAAPTSLVMSVRDLDEVLDILGPASRILVRQ